MLLRRAPGDPEVDELHPARARHQDVLWGHVPMDHLQRAPFLIRRLVGVEDSLCDADDDGDGLALADHPEAAHQLVQRGAVDVLDRDVGNVVQLAGVDDPRDRGMIEERPDARLVEEHGAELVVLRHLVAQELQNDSLIPVSRQIQLPHPSLRQQAFDLIRPDRGVGAKLGEMHVDPLEDIGSWRRRQSSRDRRATAGRRGALDRRPRRRPEIGRAHV